MVNKKNQLDRVSRESALSTVRLVSCGIVCVCVFNIDVERQGARRVSDEGSIFPKSQVVAKAGRPLALASAENEKQRERRVT